MAHPDERPDLYRAGVSSFESNHIKPQDIFVEDEKVQPGTGGASTFSQKDPTWQDAKTWILRSTTSLGPSLRAVNDAREHWCIEPSKVMTFQDYKAALRELDAQGTPYHNTESSDIAFTEPVLPNQSDHGSKTVRFVFEALKTVVQEKIFVKDWDDNDYTYLAILAKSLNSSEIELSSLVIQPDSPISKRQALVAAATMAYIKTKDEECEIADDEDISADWGNDSALLSGCLRLYELKEHPWFVEEIHEL